MVATIVVIAIEVERKRKKLELWDWDWREGWKRNWDRLGLGAFYIYICDRNFNLNSHTRIF
jgi:hypothetical protein